MPFHAHVPSIVRSIGEAKLAWISLRGTVIFLTQVYQNSYISCHKKRLYDLSVWPSNSLFPAIHLLCVQLNVDVISSVLDAVTMDAYTWVRSCTSATNVACHRKSLSVLYVQATSLSFCHTDLLHDDQLAHGSQLHDAVESINATSHTLANFVHTLDEAYLSWILAT